MTQVPRSAPDTSCILFYAFQVTLLCSTLGLSLGVASAKSAANSNCLTEIERMAPAMLAELVHLDDSYGDVQSPVQCFDPKNKAEELTCALPVLKAMELVDTKAYAYAKENATKQMIDHNDPKFYLDMQWRKNTFDKCVTAECVCKTLRQHTNDSRGGLSPYVPQQ